MFVLNQSLVNIWILYQEQIEALGLSLMSHMQFRINIGRYLFAPCFEVPQLLKAVRPGAQLTTTNCGLHKSSRRRECYLCGKLQKWFCKGCGYLWLCIHRDCYNIQHNSLWEWLLTILGCPFYFIECKFELIQRKCNMKTMVYLHLYATLVQLYHNQVLIILVDFGRLLHVCSPPYIHIFSNLFCLHVFTSIVQEEFMF